MTAADVGTPQVITSEEIEEQLLKAPHLRKKQIIFVLEYVKDFNGAQAAIRAGYTESCAKDTACEILTNPCISEIVHLVQLARARRLRLEADYVVLQFHDIYLQARAEGNYRIALKALEHLGKHLGIYEKDNRQRINPNDLELVKAQLRQRGFDIDQLQAHKAN